MYSAWIPPQLNPEAAIAAVSIRLKYALPGRSFSARIQPIA